MEDFENQKKTCNSERMMAVLNARDVQSRCAGESGKRRGSKEEQFPANEKEDSKEKARRPHQ